MRYLPVILALGVWLYGVVDVLLAPRSRVRHLPRLGWLAATVLLPVAGSIGWLVATYWPRPTPPETPRPKGRVTEADLEAYRRRLRRQAEQQRRRHERGE